MCTKTVLAVALALLLGMAALLTHLPERWPPGSTVLDVLDRTVARLVVERAGPLGPLAVVLVASTGDLAGRVEQRATFVAERAQVRVVELLELMAAPPRTDDPMPPLD